MQSGRNSWRVYMADLIRVKMMSRVRRMQMQRKSLRIIVRRPQWNLVPNLFETWIVARREVEATRLSRLEMVQRARRRVWSDFRGFNWCRCTRDCGYFWKETDCTCGYRRWKHDRQTHNNCISLECYHRNLFVFIALLERDSERRTSTLIFVAIASVELQRRQPFELAVSVHPPGNVRVHTRGTCAFSIELLCVEGHYDCIVPSSI